MPQDSALSTFSGRLRLRLAIGAGRPLAWPSEMPDNWSHEETDDPLYADRRDFYKAEKWSK
jgi:hypothetical protein